mmetsp:Transcript_18348/g.46925  ORF Transcript_18348/g.46925 Transcript_18348/m.46925 type:complete len:99 (-) Transcript_18348:83-379(-)
MVAGTRNQYLVTVEHMPKVEVVEKQALRLESSDMAGHLKYPGTAALQLVPPASRSSPRASTLERVCILAVYAIYSFVRASHSCGMRGRVERKVHSRRG